MEPRHLLRGEGLAVFLGATATYFLALEGSLWLFLVLALAPDLSMLAYLAGPRAGSVGYNLVHTYVAPLALAGVGLWLAAPLAVLAALVWAAHIGIDRFAGLGLKYPTAFGDTHLGPAGASRDDRASADDEPTDGERNTAD